MYRYNLASISQRYFLLLNQQSSASLVNNSTNEKLYLFSIQDWIYHQICCSSYPLHPLLPALLEAYVNSILVKSSKTDYTNQPIESKDIAKLFEENSVFGKVNKVVCHAILCESNIYFAF